MWCFTYDKRCHYVILRLCYTFQTKDFKARIKKCESCKTKLRKQNEEREGNVTANQSWKTIGWRPCCQHWQLYYWMSHTKTKMRFLEDLIKLFSWFSVDLCLRPWKPRLIKSSYERKIGLTDGFANTIGIWPWRSRSSSTSSTTFFHPFLDLFLEFFRLFLNIVHLCQVLNLWTAFYYSV